MIRLRGTVTLTTLAAALVLAACQENPTLVDEHDDELVADLTLSSGHVHTLSEVEVTVTVKDHHGEAVTDFEHLALERRREGDDTWREIELTSAGPAFHGSYTFSSSGEYDFRVMATSHGAAGPAEIPFTDHEMGHVKVGRAHVEVGDVRIEFESFPGHIHEGDQAAMKFWVLTAEKDANGVRQPIADLDVDLICGDPSGWNEEHHAHSHEPGVYEADHTFQGAGDASATIRFDPGQGQVEAEFDFHVVHGH